MGRARISTLTSDGLGCQVNIELERQPVNLLQIPKLEALAQLGKHLKQITETWCRELM
jgi:hypothetical protein